MRFCTPLKTLAMTSRWLPFSPCRPATQVGKQVPAAYCHRREWRTSLTNEGKQFVTGNAVLARRPVAPAVRRFDDGLVGLAVEFGLLFVDGFQVVEELEEHHPGEQRQAIHVTIQPLSLRRILRASRSAHRLSRVVSGALAVGARFLFRWGHS